MSESVVKEPKGKRPTRSKSEPAKKAVQEPMIEVMLHAGDDTYKISFREHIPAVERTMLMNQVESLYFVNGEYDPAYGDLSVLYILARMYSNETFADDLDAFEVFSNKYHLQEHLPAEAVELFGYVQEKVDFLVKKKAVPDEQAAMYRDIDLAAQKLTSVMDTINAYLEMAAKSFEGEDKASFEEISSLLKVLGRQDEKKIVESIIEYQAEKARERKAERTPIVKLAEKDK